MTTEAPSDSFGNDAFDKVVWCYCLLRWFTLQVQECLSQKIVIKQLLQILPNNSVVFTKQLLQPQIQLLYLISSSNWPKQINVRAILDRLSVQRARNNSKNDRIGDRLCKIDKRPKCKKGLCCNATNNIMIEIKVRFGLDLWQPYVSSMKGPPLICFAGKLFIDHVADHANGRCI